MPTSRKVLPTFRKYCPIGVQTAQTVLHLVHFQVQALMWAHHVFTKPMHVVKFLYITTFQWGLKVTTHYCVIVHLCFIQDQPNTIEISQIQLQSHGLSAMHMGKFLYTSTFHWGSKITTLCCFRQMYLQWLGPRDDTVLKKSSEWKFEGRFYFGMAYFPARKT